MYIPVSRLIPISVKTHPLYSEWIMCRTRQPIIELSDVGDSCSVAEVMRNASVHISLLSLIYLSPLN